MSARHTQITLFDLPSATSWLDHFESGDISAEPTLVNTRPIGGASNVGDYDREQVTKLSKKFTAELMQNSTTFQSMLDVSVFSVNSVNKIGDLRSGTITVTNTFKDASAGNALHTYPQFISTAIEITGNMLIPLSDTTLPLMSLQAVGTGGSDTARAASMIIPYSVSFGGSVLAGNAVLAGVKHSLSRDDMQMLEVKLKGRGAPTTCTGHALFTDAAGTTGDALVGLRLTTGPADYTATVAILSMTVNFADSQINKLSLSLEAQGALTIA